MSNAIYSALKKAVTTVNLRIENIKRQKTIIKFTEKVGLVYFGFVDQNSDEHRIIRGLTVSSSHRDNHYCVGSVGGYNVLVVNRSDIVAKTDKHEAFNWIIMAFDLHTQKSIPHFFIGANNHDMRHYHSLFSTYPNMHEVNLGTFHTYSPDFISRFTIFARPAKALDVEKVIDVSASKVLGAHFWPLSVEQHDNVLYIYSTIQKVTSTLLDSMFENGLWLAGYIDNVSSCEV